MGISADWLSAIATAFAAVAAFGSWRTAKSALETSNNAAQSADEAAKAAAASAAAAETLTEIERRRLHADLTPEFEASAHRKRGLDSGLLLLRLMGPNGIDHLDSVRVSIRDDKPRTPLRSWDPEEWRRIDDNIWGPYRFRHGVDGAEENCRHITEFALPVDQYKPITIEKNLGPGAEGQGGNPLLLQLVRQLDGLEPWTIRLRVPVNEQSADE